MSAKNAKKKKKIKNAENSPSKLQKFTIKIAEKNTWRGIWDGEDVAYQLLFTQLNKIKLIWF